MCGCVKCLVIVGVLLWCGCSGFRMLFGFLCSWFLLLVCLCLFLLICFC